MKTDLEVKTGLGGFCSRRDMSITVKLEEIENASGKYNLVFSFSQRVDTAGTFDVKIYYVSKDDVNRLSDNIKALV